MKLFLKKCLGVAVISVLSVTTAYAASDMTSSVTLIKGAKIFDGVSDKLIEGKDVLVEDGKIKIASDYQKALVILPL